MPTLLSDGAVEPAIGALVGVAAADGGPTHEQRALIETLVTGYWHRDPSLLDVVRSPEDVAGAVPAAEDRRRIEELLILVELCAHPPTEARLAATEAYAAAIGQGAAGTVLVRDLVRASAAQTYQDYRRLYGLPSGTTRDDPPPDPADPLRTELESYRLLPERTLGRAFFDFHERNGFALPESSSPTGALFLHHDLTHVIADYPPTGEGEIALGAMMLAVTDTDQHRLGFYGNLLVHEVGHVVPGFEQARTAVLDHRLGRTMLAEALRRGGECTGDFGELDLLAAATRDLDDVRAEFAVPPRPVPGGGAGTAHQAAAT
jgi:hypothetical protein